MEINELNKRQGIEPNGKLNKTFIQFNKLLHELRKKELPDEIVSSINNDIEEINIITDLEKELRKHIKKKQTRILKLIEKELKLVPKNHYRNIWMLLGMTAFGTPIGVAIGISLENMAFLGIGFAIGLLIGMVIGTGMDKKACEEGRQLDLEIKY